MGRFLLKIRNKQARTKLLASRNDKKKRPRHCRSYRLLHLRVADVNLLLEIKKAFGRQIRLLGRGLLKEKEETKECAANITHRKKYSSFGT